MRPNLTFAFYILLLIIFHTSTYQRESIVVARELSAESKSDGKKDGATTTNMNN